MTLGVALRLVGTEACRRLEEVGAELHRGEGAGGGGVLVRAALLHACKHASKGATHAHVHRMCMRFEAMYDSMRHHTSINVCDLII
jgi:hypothetical protein